jgi:ubiquinone/menaquinone biosynthesis C-methylase UbiE
MKTSERTFDNFDAFAENYRQIHTDNIKITGAVSDYFSEARVIEIFSHESHLAHQPIKVLDIGCGDGNTAHYFIQYFFSSKIYGIDITEKIIDAANRREIPQTEFRVFDGQRIPFENNTFDLVFMANVLHHIDRKFQLNLLKEAQRVLKSSGMIYNFEHNPYNPITQKLVKDCPFDVDAQLLSPIYLYNLNKLAGFKQNFVRFIFFFPRFGFFRKLLWLEKYFSRIPIGAQFFVKSIKS